eukprot:6172946-Pleurochrysis_carterae.AAC.3
MKETHRKRGRIRQGCSAPDAADLGFWPSRRNEVRTWRKQEMRTWQADAQTTLGRRRHAAQAVPGCHRRFASVVRTSPVPEAPRRRGRCRRAPP